MPIDLGQNAVALNGRRDPATNAELRWWKRSPELGYGCFTRWFVLERSDDLETTQSHTSFKIVWLNGNIENLRSEPTDSSGSCLMFPRLLGFALSDSSLHPTDAAPPSRFIVSQKSQTPRR